MTATHDDSATAEDEESLVRQMDPDALLASVESETVKNVVKLLLGVGGLVFLLGLASFLPGLERLVPATPITFASLVVALVTLGIVAVLVYVAPQLETLVEQGLDADDAVATHAGAIVKHLVVLLAALVAFQGLSGAFVPFLAQTNSVLIYDLSFLVLALVPTALIAVHLYRGLDPAAELLTAKVTTTGTAIDADENVDDAGETAESVSDSQPENEPGSDDSPQ